MGHLRLEAVGQAPALGQATQVRNAPTAVQIGLIRDASAADPPALAWLPRGRLTACHYQAAFSFSSFTELHEQFDNRSASSRSPKAWGTAAAYKGPLRIESDLPAREVPAPRG